jgi:hypothetical protein
MMEGSLDPMSQRYIRRRSTLAFGVKISPRLNRYSPESCLFFVSDIIIEYIPVYIFCFYSAIFNPFLHSFA